ncbi:aldose 1-epimerase family protein [Asanoa sp. WMMD1127]|uniref:aldose 1-epimerase family protein n=1 Tax=Asanoa sp. WMMD1127 TaxID=3016107 RepID=UPI0024176360|nr:aldose 1-epimerase family protein [Asanoa sp. WMMD1127]MDG4821506.1 aldose 1-epimerase family protein [Asanoa sp. WMMD1127]
MTNRTAPPKSGTQWTIAADGQEAVVVEVGGGLRAYRAGGVDYLDGYAEDELPPGSSGQILAPWPSRIRDGRYTFAGEAQQLPITEPARHNAIHGLVAWQRWRLVEHTDSAVLVECDLPAQVGYPWQLNLRTRYSLGPDGLRIDHEVTNIGADAAPFGLAAHPYFRLPGTALDDLMVTVPGRSRVLFDARLLPIGAAKVSGGDHDFTVPRRLGAQVLDNAFGDLDRDPDGTSAVVISDGDRTLRVWAGEQFKWWVVFTSDTLHGDRHRRAMAIEPQTCPPDAFRSGHDVVVLAPGDTWSASWGVQVSRAG